ncbi:N-acetyl-alpha-D-glucosaminyl L-malate synthase BshA [Rhodocaloribacter litoris]|uniref:N-acetyl-alpha-D-glucosaminyl L-malate synthase BshA n=1 Tax=Rhodocaloribacter litoris TaxID=2558931 RepID=UPI001424317D|nr:N-acetyl-alpha-D-glucosaminyl L-malate synthase BshA [Rhodocaloribacter litoris]QXD14557.1 N-acetyl-alpha-D-glucosaminyl L-malate synthase BshA [Rhodocaloribacter litoris]GIV59674.1 MAG: N-acetyl-alpha-D-glucosaminyl L-malate synthase BshA [Rhodothermaceae bacterium]
MKIGITCYPVYGGSGVVATELGKALAARGHQIHFIAYSMPFRLGSVQENIFFHEVNVNAYPLFEYPPYTLNLTSKMVDVVKYERLDLLHVHYAIPHATSAVLARDILATEGLHVPVVTTLHGTDITIVGRDPSFAPVVSYSINRSDGVTAVSEYLRQETLCCCGGVTAEIEVIPNFIDTRRFRRTNKEHFKQAICPKGEKLLVHVSNFRPVKRAPEVVEVFHRLRSENLPVKLILVGDGPDRVPTEHLARQRGVYEDIRFLGKQEPVEEILSIADVFLMPSGSETFGLAALEAMACEVPVVASNIGGLPELVVDGETGFLCPLGDIEAFTARTREILLDEALHARMAKAARARAVNTFDVRHIVPLYEAYYERVRERMLSHSV